MGSAFLAAACLWLAIIDCYDGRSCIAQSTAPNIARGFNECSDCHFPLVREKPEKAEQLGDPDLQKNAGIPFYVLGDEIAPRYAPVVGFTHSWRRVQVGCDHEREARKLLQPLQRLPQARKTEEDGEPDPAA